MKKTGSKLMKKVGALCVYRCSAEKDCGIFNWGNQKYDQYKSTTTGNLLYKHAGYGVCC